jgi:HEAT repeat protein
MLALLNAKQAAPRMVRALQDSAAVSKAAFPHIAYALGRLGGEQSKEALEQFLYDDEPWFCVDAAGALAHWPLAAVGQLLLKALLTNHSLSDYVAVVIARKHKPREFFESTHPSARDGACAMVIALIDAAGGTFSNDVIEEFELVECAPMLLERALAAPNPLNVRAALALLDWVETHGQPESIGLSGDELTAKLERLRGSDVEQSIVSTLRNWQDQSPENSAQLRQAVILAGDLQMKSVEPFLIDMLNAENKLLDSVVDALGKISDQQVTERLIALAKQLVDMRARTGLPLGKQPVAEQDAPACKTYWHILRALGQLQDPHSAGYLLEATNDHAPDKREQAFASLLLVCEVEVSAKYLSEIKEAVTRGLSDPAPQVRTIALDGVASLEIESVVSEVVKLTDSIEISVSRKAFDVLARLCQGAHKGAVAKAVEEAARAQSNKFRKDRLLEFLAVNAR